MIEDLYCIGCGVKLQCDNENDYYKFYKSQHLENEVKSNLKSITQVSSAYINPHCLSFTKPTNYSFRHPRFYISRYYRSRWRTGKQGYYYYRYRYLFRGSADMGSKKLEI